MTVVYSLQLHDPRAKWSEVKLSQSGLTIWGRGYAFIDQSYYENEELVRKVLSECQYPSPQEQTCAFKRLIPTLNGCWAMGMRASDGTVLAAVDRSRSIPLFYARTNRGYVIAASAEDIAREVRNPEISTASAAEYMLSGYVSGPRTLYKGVYQIQPGALVEFRCDDTKLQHVARDYFHYFSVPMTDAPHNDLEEELEHILDTTFARLARVLAGKNLILPLSGGYDSRLIAWMLKKHGVDNVVCYTYGVARDPQREMAQKVAKVLGFEWRFIEYDAQRWADCMCSSEMVDYLDYAFRGTSSPHIQDFPAVMELTQSLALDDPPVFLPGHVGDAWAGGYIVRRLEEKYHHPPAEYHSDYTDILGCPVVSAIVYQHLNLWPVSPDLWNQEPWASVARNIYRDIAGYKNLRCFGVWTHVEWMLRSRLALWIVNSCRCFEYFGGTFMLPLGTNELIDFFKKLPMNLALDSKLYLSTLTNKLLGGPGHPLRGIPVRSSSVHAHYKWSKKALLNMLLKVRLYKPLDRLRRPFRSPHGLYAESWFTKGKRPEEVTIREAIASHGDFEALPNELQAIVSPLLNKPAYSVQCNSLLTVVGLIDYYSALRRIKKEGTGAYMLTSNS